MLRKGDNPLFIMPLFIMSLFRQWAFEGLPGVRLNDRLRSNVEVRRCYARLDCVERRFRLNGSTSSE